jgi:hypothetical protein
MTLFYATKMFHTNLAIKYYFRVPIMIIAEVLFNGRFESLNQFLSLKKVLNCWSFILDLKSQHTRLEKIVKDRTRLENIYLIFKVLLY